MSDYANIYSHAHDLNDGMIVSNHKTEIGPKARITYHATVMSGVKVGEHGMVGSMGVASKRCGTVHRGSRYSGQTHQGEVDRSRSAAKNDRKETVT